MFYQRLTTERLILRPFELKDIAPSYDMEQDPAINQYTNDGGVKTEQEVAQLIRHLIEVDYQKYGFGRFALELKATGEFIGFCGLKWLEDEQEVDLGYRLKRACWGQGLATEASRAALEYGFKIRRLNRIIATILPDNIASRRVLEKLHFTFEKAFLEDGVLIHQFVLTKLAYEQSQ